MCDSYLRSGIFLAPFHALRENPTLALERDLELLQHLDRLGYHEAWIGEHHSGGFEIIASPEVFIAAAAERTRHIRLGTGVASLPYHNPFILADRMVLLDHITRGRAMFGVGPGALVHDAVKIGIQAGDQRRMMHESLDVIVRLLSGETVTERTDWYDLCDARLQLPCYTQPVMELAVAASRSPTGALAAGRHGIGMLSIGGTSPEAMTHHAKNWGLYEEQARLHGKTTDRRNWRLVTMFHIAETREQARENVCFGLEAFAQYFRDVATFPIVPAGIGDAYQWLLANKAACIGTPDDAIGYIETLLQGSGGFGAILELAHNWADWEATRRHYELMARYVHPHFQHSRTLRRASYDFAAANGELFRAQSQAAVQAAIDRGAAPRATE
ncbi:MAG TPA: LLM class flavin-dependent oxidoreductase [Acetobacteraceae bacterium]|nr:LLM class flavin-dependent oxidoreductase [Acetobacteraceae bacterium]